MCGIQRHQPEKMMSLNLPARPVATAACALLLAAGLPAAARAASAESRWLDHVKILAADDMEGRLTGTPGYDRAAQYVAGQFQKLGLRPAGSSGFSSGRSCPASTACCRRAASARSSETSRLTRTRFLRTSTCTVRDLPCES